MIDPDRIARRLNPADPRAVDREAGAEAIRLFRRTLLARQSMSLETTLAGHTVLKRMAEAKDAGYIVGLRYVALPIVELNVIRVESRAKAGGHYIDPDVIRSRVSSSFANLPRAVAIAHRTIIYDNSGERHLPILDIEEGKIRRLAEMPSWLQALRPSIEAALAGA